MSRSARSRRRVGLVLALLLLAGCAGPHLVAIPSPGALVEADGQRTTATSRGLTVTADLAAPASAAAREHLFPLRVRVEHAGPGVLPLTPGDFLLLSEDGLQVAALAPAEAAVAAAGPDRGPGVSPHISVGAAGPHPTVGIFGIGLVFGAGTGGAREALLAAAFPFGTLTAGGRAEGFLYFPRAPAKGRLTLLVLPAAWPAGAERLALEFRWAE
ncbi:MAG: hypothetical protein L0214_02350 [candidate division NC10 bacterium]|nr:hypothetical protein [candidate division NC10 bacterium]